MNRGVHSLADKTSRTPRFRMPLYHTQGRRLALSLGMFLIAVGSRLVVQFSSRQVREEAELVISSVLILLGSIHGSLDIFKLRSLSSGNKKGFFLLLVATYSTFVILGASALVLSTHLIIPIFIAISLIHFAVIEFEKRVSDSRLCYRVFISCATSIAVFAFTFRTSSSFASSLLLRLLGNERSVALATGWASHLAIGSLIAILIMGLTLKSTYFELIEEISLVVVLLIAPSLVVFSLFYGLRHGVDQWVIDRSSVKSTSLRRRDLWIVLAGTAILLSSTVMSVGLFMAIVAVGFGLTLAHVSLDFGFRLRR